MVVKDKSDSETRPLTGWDVIVDLAQMWRDERNDKRQHAFDLAERTGELVEKSVRSVMPLALLLMGAPAEAPLKTSDGVERLMRELLVMPAETVRKVASLLESERQYNAASALRIMLADEASRGGP